MSFSEKLQNLRKEKKYSQEKLADLLDVTRQSVSKWESGQTYPEMDKLLSLCKIFNCTLDELTNDEITEISTEKKTGFNSIVDSILELVTKTYKMITNMSFKELIRCLLLMFIVALVLLIFYIPLQQFQYGLYYVIESFGSQKAADVLTTLLNFLLDITYSIVYLLLFIHIFKIGFLDKYEFVQKEELELKGETEKINKSVEEKIIKEEKAIKVNKEPNYAFYDTLSKLIMFFVKMMIIFFVTPFIFTFIFLFALLVINIYFIFTGITYFSIPILIIFSIVLNFIIIELLTNIIFNKKNNYKRMLIMFITSIAGLGIGSGVFILDVHNTEIIDDVPKELKEVNNVYEYEYVEGLYFDFFGDVEYIVDSSIKNKVNVNINSYEGINNIKLSKNIDGYYIHNYDIKPSFIMEIIDIIIEGLKDKKVYNLNSYDHIKLTITSNENIINKLKENLDNYYNERREADERYEYYQSNIESLNEKLYELENDNYDLQTEIDELIHEKNSLKKEIEDYKERIKSAIENEN